MKKPENLDLNINVIRKLLDSLKIEIQEYNKYPLRNYYSYNSKYNIKNVVFEIFNILRYSFKGNNMFNPSFFPDFYYRENKSYNLFKLFVMGENIELSLLPNIITERLELFTESLLLKVNNKVAKANYRVVSYEDQIFLTDFYSSNKDMVWLSSDSFNTARMVKKYFSPDILKLQSKSKVKIADLCCGNGFCGFYINSFFHTSDTYLFGLDINKKAIEYCNLNAELNNIVNYNFNIESLYDFESDEKYDIIISNPAYGSSDYEKERICHFGGELGFEQVVKVFEIITNNLSKDGVFFVTADSPIFKNKSMLLEKLKELFEAKLNINYIVLQKYETSDSTLENNKSEIYSKRERVFLYGKRGNGISKKNCWHFEFKNRF